MKLCHDKLQHIRKKKRRERSHYSALFALCNAKVQDSKRIRVTRLGVLYILLPLFNSNSWKNVLRLKLTMWNTEYYCVIKDVEESFWYNRLINDRGNIRFCAVFGHENLRWSFLKHPMPNNMSDRPVCILFHIKFSFGHWHCHSIWWHIAQTIEKRQARSHSTYEQNGFHRNCSSVDRLVE